VKPRPVLFFITGSVMSRQPRSRKGSFFHARPYRWDYFPCTRHYFG
jgi:hypothetical protein